MLSLCVSGCLGGIHGKFHLPLNQPAFVFFGQLEKDETTVLKGTVSDGAETRLLHNDLLEAVSLLSRPEKWAITQPCFREAEGFLTGSWLFFEVSLQLSRGKLPTCTCFWQYHLSGLKLLLVPVLLLPVLLQ